MSSAEKIAAGLVVLLLPMGLFVLTGQVQERSKRLREQRDLEDRIMQAKRNSELERQKMGGTPVATPVPEADGPNFLERLRQTVGSTFTVRGDADSTPVTYGDLDGDGVKQFYRQQYEKSGIRDTEYIEMNVLNDTNSDYVVALSAANEAIAQKDLETARSELQRAIDELPANHLIGRMKLLDILHEVELRATNYEEAKRLYAEKEGIRLKIAEMTGRAMMQAGHLSGEQAQALEAYAKGKQEGEGALQDLQNMFTPPGEDPEKAPQRVLEMIQLAAEAQEKMKSTGGSQGEVGQ